MSGKIYANLGKGGQDIIELGDNGESWNISLGTTASLVEFNHMFLSNVLALVLQKIGILNKAHQAQDGTSCIHTHPKESCFRSKAVPGRLNKVR